ncbi:hypothetical protein Tco_0678219 [Tanacetum coccineum]|uniref:Uncharacterized protein n=1 Tax=Tanacetum coccineum TaxID=301880 RepID=A0ABQ4XFJ9_9ASTR
MHNNIMAAGSRDRPPMLATGRYAQWRSRFLRYIDTRNNGDALRKCILEGPYTPSTVIIPVVPTTENSPLIPEQTTVETVLNMSPKNKAHFESEKEAIHLILTGIGDEIYSTVDACQTAHEMWEAIERLQQGESLNIQDVKTNLFWEFGKFTSHDGESIESYYSRFYKLMNEMIRNNLTVDTMQVNVQFLQQLQLEWSRFVTIVKQQHKLDEVSYHKFFDILKQYQKEVNEIRAERIAKNANPLALVATAQPYQDPYYQTSKLKIFQVTPKVSHLHAVKRIFRYLKGQPKLGLWYPKDSPFDLEAYSDSDYASASLDRKSTTGGCQFLGSRLISWQCKKQTIVANSTTKAEYVAAASCCGQVLWIQNQMLDYGYNFMNTKIFIDNESTICIVKNPVFHSKTKHIEIRHHFIRDSNEKKLIQMIKIHTDQNVADLLTKAFDVGRFQYLIASIGMLNL